MNTSRVRARLEMQGFCGLDDSAVKEMNIWLRLTPALCALLVAAATFIQSVPLFVAVAATAFLGAIFAHHPFDYIYNAGLRRITGTRMLPPNGAPRRFACGIATVWLSVTAWSFAAGAITAGRILGTLFVVTAMIPVLTHFCVPSFLFQWIAARRSAAALNEEGVRS